MAVTIPGFDEAIESERVDRALAFLPIQERICGLPCVKLTPLLAEYLRASGNPFMVGGKVEPVHYYDFLWRVNPDFLHGNQAEFYARIGVMETPKLHQGIDEYLDRTFLDSPQGRTGKPFFSMAAGLIHDMACDPFRWDVERTLNTPICQMLQLIKARDHAHGHTVVNKRSDGVAGDWLGSLVVKSAKTEGRLRGIVARMVKKGWVQSSAIAPRYEADASGSLVLQCWDVSLQRGGWQRGGNQ